MAKKASIRTCIACNTSSDKRSLVRFVRTPEGDIAFDASGKSAGRVQSPAVRLLVEREQEIAAFEAKADFKVTAIFTHEGETIKAELPERFATEEAARMHLQKAIMTQYLEVLELRIKFNQKDAKE